ncbi:STAS domain-containing protein [Streptomyces leeuwenhoekii]|uniref:Anti-sigma factor antagonist n=1 Tax=Streptomyces leeuwenhoekii TaxID=1437453 RepID=A0A0F7VKP9_STRLW|nr:STAS domain-containing protein [Streptomyces leeuwenhoekii]CQR59484.1 Anti-Sigma F Factor Antagonist [Streptomyces leeuwenhoekii]
MSQAQLSVSRHTTADGVHVVTLAGDIDHTTADILRQALTAPDGTAPHTVADFRDVTFMDSSGINILVAANNTACSRGGWLRLAHTPTPVLDLLHIVGLDTIIPLHPTLDDALTPQTTT